MVTIHVLLIALGYFDFYARFGVLTLVIPYGLATVWCARYRDARTVFSIANGFFVGCVCGANGYLAQALFPSIPFLPLLVRVISLILLYFVLKEFAQTCRQALRQLDHGWTILCLIPTITGLLALYTNRKYFQPDPLPAVIILFGPLLICGCAYYLMYLFFGRVQKENLAQHEAQLSALQLSALQSRMEAVRSAEEIIRTERHDLRHRLQTVTELVSRGEKEAALDFLNAAQKRLDEQKEIRWCRPPVLDAVFSTYFEQAKNQNIQVEAKISLPEKLAVNEGELAVVLANALENAIHTNLSLPPKRRKLRCRMVGTPSVVLELSNPCDNQVTFDDHGLPMAKDKGHGLGVRSIASFCQKHGAVYQLSLTEGIFRLRLVL